MKNENIPVTEQELLFDPMFARKPDSVISDNPSKGIFGKIALKKAAFITVLAFFIILSMYFSFRTVSKDVYTYEECESFEDGSPAYRLTEYHGDSRTVLSVDFVRRAGNEAKKESSTEEGTTEAETTEAADIAENNKDIVFADKPVKEVGRYAINCNESLVFIFISDTVEYIDAKAFYTCKNLQAFFVDENNKNYKSIDGVLYRCVNGEPVEVMLFPAKNPEYHAAISMGLAPPVDEEDCEEYIAAFNALQDEKKTADENGEEKNSLMRETEKDEFSTYVLPDSVITINELCFAEAYSLRHIVFNDKLTEIETMAFFKCNNLQELNIPDTVTVIGSDAFSSCISIKDIFIPKSVKTIGHHAFYNCSGVDVVRLECSEEEAEQMELGSAWLPEKRKIIMRPIGVSYNEAREVK